MMNAKQRYVLKPSFNNLSEYRLNYRDILTYITIRSFYNHTEKCCYPSFNTLSKLSGLSKKFLAESIKRLECANFLDIWKLGKIRTRHCYKFNDEGVFHKVPVQLFDVTDLTESEKSMLLVLREHCNSMFECDKSITEIGTSSGLTYRTIYSQMKALILKGYVVELERECPLNKTIEKFFKLTEKIKWNFSGTTSVAIEQHKQKSDVFDIDEHINMVKKVLRIGIR